MTSPEGKRPSLRSTTPKAHANCRHLLRKGLPDRARRPVYHKMQQLQGQLSAWSPAAALRKCTGCVWHLHPAVSKALETLALEDVEAGGSANLAVWFHPASANAPETRNTHVSSILAASPDRADSVRQPRKLFGFF
jgi:hypothetical protein